MRMRVPIAAGLALALACSGCDGGGDAAAVTTAPPHTTVAATTTEATTTTAVAATTTAAATTTPPGSTTIPPEAANRVVIGEDQEPETLNPFAPGGDNQAVRRIGQAIYAGLTEVHGETLEIVPDLAAEIPTADGGAVTVADDGTTTVLFRIRDEAVWQDGTPVTGADVAFTYEAIMGLEESPFDRAPYEALQAVAAEPGSKEVTLTFPAPTLVFETMFPVVLPAHQMEGTDPVADWEIPWLSAGPFRFESWEPGTAITLTRNERYWKTDPRTGEPLPGLEEVEFRFIPDSEQLIDAFTSGEIDVVLPWVWPALYDRIRALDGAELQVRDSGIWEHFTFQFGENNRNEDSLNEYVEFRRAVAHAIDRGAITDLGFWGADQFLDGFLSLHGVPGPGPWEAYPYDPGRARALLTGLCAELARDCATDPPRMVLSTTSNADERPRIANALVQMLAEVGIELTLDLEDSMLFFGPTLDNGTWDLGLWAWLAQPGAAGIASSFGVFDPDAPLQGDPGAPWQEREGSNYARWGTPAVTGQPATDTVDFNQGPSRVRDEHTARFAEVLDEMAATADRAEFLELAREAEAILADQMVIIPLVARSSAGAVWADRIVGYVHSPWVDTWNIESWQRVSS